MLYPNSKYWDFCALAAGALFILSFAPFEHSSLALIALAILFSSWRNLSAKRAALRGYLFGLGAYGSGVSWVYISMHDFGGAGIVGSSLLTALFAGSWALFPALAGYISAKTGQPSNGTASILRLPIVWMLVEYIRGNWVLNGFPWFHIAYSQMDTPLAGYIPIIGVYGTGLIMALTASIAVEIVYTTAWSEISLSAIAGGNVKTALRLMQAKNIPNSKQPKSPLALILLAAALWATGGWLSTVNWTQPIGQPILVSMIQGNIAQDQKWRPENKINTLLKYKRMTEEHWDSQVLIWPETAIPAYLDQVKDTFLMPLANDAKQHGADLIISVPIHEHEHKYNGVITFGKTEGRYFKTHLLPFGEYLPLQPLSGFVLDLVNIKLGNFTPGASDQPLMTAGGYPFITLICYEDAFGDLGIRGLPDAAYLVNVTNDGWFGNSIEPHQHMQIARMRAIETGRYLLRSTNTGITAIVSPKGNIVAQAPLFQETVLSGTITPMGGMTPYAKWGDTPAIVLIVIVFSATTIGRIVKNQLKMGASR
jgi:apolipoprotein N-acyltransferase